MVQTQVADKYAIFETGGKQYQAVEGLTIQIEKLDLEPGQEVEFDTVMLRKTAPEAYEVGKPYLKTTVKASVLKHIRGPKLIAFRFKRRKKVRVKQGHRQEHTVIRVVSI